MKKQSQTFFKQVYTKPLRTQSPDFRSSNSIRPTRSPDNIEYSLKQNDRAHTPVKNNDTATKQYNTAASRYFPGNRSAIEANRSSKPTYSSYNTQQFESIKSYCHECCSGNCHCVHATNNEEVVIELKKIITMINGAAVSPFDVQNETTNKQLEMLKMQNNRLLELVEKLKSRSEVNQEYTSPASESEIRSLKQQLAQKQSQIGREREQLYRANKTLSSQLKSLQDKYQGNQRQLQSLRTQMKIRDELDSDSKRKNPQQKLSWSIIKDQYKEQYNSSIKTLKSNMEFEINNQLSDYENEIRQLNIKVQLLQERLMNAERVNKLNRALSEQNNKLKKKFQQLSAGIDQSSKSGQPIDSNNADQLSKLQRQNKQLNDYSSILTKQLSETKAYYENQLVQLKVKNAGIEQKISKETEVRVTKLMENYEQEIKILKSANNKASSANVCNHKGIEDENRNLKDQNEQNWQEVIRLRNELVKYTADNTKLENQIIAHKNQISRLNHQINNDHLNLVARTTLLQNENARLRVQLENLMSRADRLEQQNKKIKEEGVAASSNIPDIASLKYENQELKNDLAGTKSDYQKLQEENNKLFYEIDRINSEHSKKQLQIRQNLKRQLEQTKILYEDQINQAHEEYRQVSDQLENLKLSHKQLQLEAQNLQQHRAGSQSEQQKKIRQHELTISNLSKIIEQTEEKMIYLEQVLNKKQQQKQVIVKQLGQSKQESDRNLRECVAYWQNQVRVIKNNHEAELTNLRKEIADKDREEQDIFMKMKTKMSVYHSDSLRKELEQLKKLVDEGRFLKIQEEFIKIVENYERELIRSEQKTMEIDSLTKDKCALEEKNSDLERLRLMLEQKTNILEGSIKVVQNELKERKILCDSLLNQKVILEKQNLMLKKIKLDRESIEATKAKARQISQKIDKLLSMEEKRQQNFIQASQAYSQVMVESKSKRLEI